LTLLTVAIVLFSAFLHASWNLASKTRSSGLGFITSATAMGALIYSPMLLSLWPKIPGMPLEFWLLLLGTGLCQAMYLIGLTKAYQTGQMNIVYPLARALPVLIVPLAVLLVVGQTQLTVPAIMGMVAIFVGALMVPVQNWRNWRIGDYFNASLGWVVLTALGTVGYSVIDSQVIAMLRERGASAMTAGSGFVVLQSLSTVPWVMLCSALFLKENAWRGCSLRSSILGGVAMTGTYMLILIAMGLASEVSYVVALRQASIPIGVLLSLLILKEALPLPRIQGVVVITLGLILVSL